MYNNLIYWSFIGDKTKSDERLKSEFKTGKATTECIVATRRRKNVFKLLIQNLKFCKFFDFEILIRILWISLSNYH